MYVTSEVGFTLKPSSGFVVKPNLHLKRARTRAPGSYPLVLLPDAKRQRLVLCFRLPPFSFVSFSFLLRSTLFPFELPLMTPLTRLVQLPKECTLMIVTTNPCQHSHTGLFRVRGEETHNAFSTTSPFMPWNSFDLDVYRTKVYVASHGISNLIHPCTTASGVGASTPGTRVGHSSAKFLRSDIAMLPVGNISI